MTPKATENMLNKMGVKWFKSGSQEICRPAPPDSDYDYFVIDTGLVLRSLSHELALIGFEPDGVKYDDPGEFTSLRESSINIIVCHTDPLFRASKVATRLAKKRNLQDKEDRIKLFEDIRSKYLEKERKRLRKFVRSSGDGYFIASENCTFINWDEYLHIAGY